MSELKPCPCGNKKTYQFCEDGDHYVACDRCTFEARERDWNTRANPWQPIETVNELIIDLVTQALHKNQDGTYDSGAISTYGEALEYLESIGVFKVEKSYGRMVVGRFIESTQPPITGDK